MGFIWLTIHLLDKLDCFIELLVAVHIDLGLALIAPDDPGLSVHHQAVQVRPGLLIVTVRMLLGIISATLGPTAHAKPYTWFLLLFGLFCCDGFRFFFRITILGNCFRFHHVFFRFNERFLSFTLTVLLQLLCSSSLFCLCPF